MKIEEICARLLLHEVNNRTEAIVLAGNIISEIIKIDSIDNVDISKNISNKVDSVIKPVSKIVNKPSGKILAPKGNKCVCSSCKEFIYQNVADVYEQGMATEDFIAAYAPVGNASYMQESNLDDVLVAEGGAMYIDCPSCKGSKSLEIIPARSIKKESPSVERGSPLSGIVSINPGQFGG